MAGDLRILNDIELVLKEVWSSGSKKYVFKLCCKTILQLYNPCPGQNVALRLDKCLSALGNVFCVEPLETGIKLDKQVINVETESGEATVTESGGWYLIDIPTDPIEHLNTICIKDLCIPVSPDCLDDALIGQCAPLSAFLEPVCVQGGLSAEERQLLFDCYFEVYNNWATLGAGIPLTDGDSIPGSTGMNLIRQAIINANTYDEFPLVAPTGPCEIYNQPLTDGNAPIYDTATYGVDSTLNELMAAQEVHPTARTALEALECLKNLPLTPP